MLPIRLMVLLLFTLLGIWGSNKASLGACTNGTCADLVVEGSSILQRKQSVTLSSGSVQGLQLQEVGNNVVCYNTHFGDETWVWSLTAEGCFRRCAARGRCNQFAYQAATGTCQYTAPRQCNAMSIAEEGWKMYKSSTSGGNPNAGTITYRPRFGYCNGRVQGEAVELNSGSLGDARQLGKADCSATSTCKGLMSELRDKDGKHGSRYALQFDFLSPEPRRSWQAVLHRTFCHFKEVVECDASFNFLSGPNGVDYRGCQTRTVSGKICQKWTQQTPHSHSRTPERLGRGVGDHNYCRNPAGERSIWCYTTDPGTRWEICSPGCRYGYTTLTSDIPTDRDTDLYPQLTCEHCADVCDDDETCFSYACSATVGNCSLNVRFAGAYQDYDFCLKKAR
jgi:hypothetical protein